MSGAAGDAQDLPAPVLVIDANEDMADVPDIYSRHEKAVMGGIGAAAASRAEDGENADPNSGTKGVAASMATSPRKVLAKV